MMEADLTEHVDAGVKCPEFAGEHVSGTELAALEIGPVGPVPSWCPAGPSEAMPVRLVEGSRRR